jgi:beta-phosphoglucomutase-like phosphatase (HAD superfamily)
MKDDLIAETAKQNATQNPPSQLIIFDCFGLMEDADAQELPVTFIEDYRKELRVVVENELKSVPGDGSALEQIDVLKCVASNGPRRKIEHALRVTSFCGFF